MSTGPECGDPPPSAASLPMALAFSGVIGWIVFAALRFLVGFGYGGAGASQFALIAEYTPLARRSAGGAEVLSQLRRKSLMATAIWTAACRQACAVSARFSTTRRNPGIEDDSGWISDVTGISEAPIKNVEEA